MEILAVLGGGGGSGGMELEPISKVEVTPVFAGGGGRRGYNCHIENRVKVGRGPGRYLCPCWQGSGCHSPLVYSRQ